MEKIFISSVQKEFAKERKSLAKYFREDSLLSTFFEPFLFEEVAASGLSPQKVYLGEVGRSSIYIGLLGFEYGFEDKDGVSPTEREYNAAKNKNLPRWVFILSGNETNRHVKEKAFISKIGDEVSRKRFTTLEELKNEVYNSCVRYLKQTGKIETHDFDDSLHPDATAKIIDKIKIKDFVANARIKRNFPLKENASVNDVLSHLNMMRNGKFVNSALLAFAKKPQQFFPTAIVKCAHFHGIHIQKPIPDFKEFDGTVFEMAGDAVDFVLSKISLSTGTRAKRNQVETVYEVPREVIAEAIVNAVAHRNYYSKGSVQVSVFKDRIEVSNPGSLPPELELSDLKIAHASYPHNPLLANCMFLTGDIERYGTGTLAIYSLTKAKGLSTPVFSIDEGFKVVIWRPSAKAIHDTVHETDHQTDHEVKYLAMENLAHRVIWIVRKASSAIEIMTRLELKHRRNFTLNYLYPAIESEWLEMTIPNNPKSKKQKYRLTRKGMVLKKQLEKEYSSRRSKVVTDHETDYENDHEAGHDTDHEAGALLNENLVHRFIRLINGEVSRNEIMGLLQLKHRRNLTINYLNPAIENKWLEMTIPNNPKSKKQKYRLTAKGKALQKKLNK